MNDIDAQIATLHRKNIIIGILMTLTSLVFASIILGFWSAFSVFFVVLSGLHWSIIILSKSNSDLLIAATDVLCDEVERKINKLKE